MGNILKFITVLHQSNRYNYKDTYITLVYIRGGEGVLHGKWVAASLDSFEIHYI